MTNEAEIFHGDHKPQVGKLMPTPVGSMNYNVLRALLEEGNVIKNGVGAEIGVFRADTSEHLLKSFPNLTLYCIDPYLEYSEYESNRTQTNMSKHEEVAKARLSQFNQRVALIKEFSVPAARKISDDSLDFVFIDAIHTYDAVMEDLHAWYPKVRKDGLIAGHDVSWSGVKEAVEQFLAHTGKVGFYTPSTSDVWFFVK